MRKMIALIIVLALFPAACLAAEISEDDFIGLWAQTWKAGMNSWRISTIQINEDHNAFITVQFFTDNQPGETNSSVCSWEIEGNKIIFSDKELTHDTLYLSKKHRLSADAAGTHYFFEQVPTYAVDYDTIMEDMEPEPIDLNPCGQWSYYDGATDLNKTILLYDTGVISFNLFFYEDGSVYLSEAYLKKESSGLHFVESSSGLWIGDHEDMSFKIAGSNYKANISEDGLMHVHFPSGKDYVFTKVKKN